MKAMRLFLLFIFFPLFSYSQDKITTTSNDVVKCRILDTTGKEIKYKDAKDGWSYSSNYKYIKSFTFNGKLYNNKKEYIKDESDADAEIQILYSEVVKVDSTISKSELFSRARAWCSSEFNNSKTALDVQDKESGELIGNGVVIVFAIPVGDMPFEYGAVKFRFTILVKDGRYKYEFSNFEHIQTVTTAGYISYGTLTTNTTAPEGKRCLMCGNKINNKYWNSIKKSATDQIESGIIRLKEAMSKPITGKSDW